MRTLRAEHKDKSRLSLTHPRLILGLLALLITILYGCSAGSFRLADADLAQPTTVVRVPSFRALYDEALEVAQTWQPDAYLAGASSPVEWQHYPQVMSGYFRFRSKQVSWLALLVTVSEDLQVSAEGTVMAYSSPAPPAIMEVDWILDSTEALRIAQDHGGSEFLGQYDSEALVHLYLEHQKRVTDGPVVWRISYRSSAEQLSITVDARTGEILSSNNR